MRHFSYEEGLKECDIATVEKRRLRRDQIIFFRILKGYENIVSHSIMMVELEDMR